MPNLLLVFGLIICRLFGISAEWQSVEADECGFAVSMPAQPEITVDSTQTPAGLIVTRSYAAFDEPDSYTVGCSSFPASYFAAVDKAAFLDGAVERFAAGTSGETLSRENVEIEGHPGRRYAVRVGEVVLYNEAYVVGRRVYQLSVSKGEEVGFGEDEGLTRFFGSFELRP